MYGCPPWSSDTSSAGTTDAGQALQFVEGRCLVGHKSIGERVDAALGESDEGAALRCDREHGLAIGAAWPKVHARDEPSNCAIEAFDDRVEEGRVRKVSSPGVGDHRRTEYGGTGPGA